ncbi:MAG: DNA repair protein RadC [Thiogranum sp.]|nr:DNA repair protein RadC [Thiogranum sp.]
MSIRHWPETERPREKLLSLGPQSLSDAELLAIFLRTGIAGQNAVELARALIGEYGGLRALLRADKRRFCATRGLGHAKYAQLQAVLELGRRHLREGLARGDMLKNPSDTETYLTSRLRDYPYEVFACLFLDTRHRVITYEELFQGTIDSATVHPREVVRRALQHNAAAVILAHNHPSGLAEPSEADRRITGRLKDALGLVDIRVLDHFVIGDRGSVSFSQRGWL